MVRLAREVPVCQCVPPYGAPLRLCDHSVRYQCGYRRGYLNNGCGSQSPGALPQTWERLGGIPFRPRRDCVEQYNPSLLLPREEEGQEHGNGPRARGGAEEAEGEGSSSVEFFSGGG